MTLPDELVRVHLVELPVALAAKSRQHFEELMREFALIAAGVDAEHTAHNVPARLMRLVDTLVVQFGGVTDRAEQRLDDAIDHGESCIADHTLTLPAAAGEAAQHLNDLIDEADEYCRYGQHLLTLASPPECVAYRRWYLGEVSAQIAGAAPTPWPGVY